MPTGLTPSASSNSVMSVSFVGRGDPLVGGLVVSILQTRVVDIGSVQVKAFDLKYTIATSVNVTWNSCRNNWRNSEESVSGKQRMKFEERSRLLRIRP